MLPAVVGNVRTKAGSRLASWRGAATANTTKTPLPFARCTYDTRNSHPRYILLKHPPKLYSNKAPFDSANMADIPPPKPDPTAEQATAPGATLVPEETAKVTTEATQEKPATASVADTVTNAAATATSAVKDNVFSMFGGGPKKEKREEADDVDEPSGGSKGKAAEVRRVIFVFYCITY